MTNTAKQITSYLEQLRFKTQHIYTVLCQSLEILFIYLYLVRKMVNPYRNMYFWKYFFFKRQIFFFNSTKLKSQYFRCQALLFNTALTLLGKLSCHFIA